MTTLTTVFRKIFKWNIMYIISLFIHIEFETVIKIFVKNDDIVTYAWIMISTLIYGGEIV